MLFLLYARSIGRLLDHDSLVKPLPLVKDGDCFCPVHDLHPKPRDGSGH